MDLSTDQNFLNFYRHYKPTPPKTDKDAQQNQVTYKINNTKQNKNCEVALLTELSRREHSQHLRPPKCVCFFLTHFSVWLKWEDRPLESRRTSLPTQGTCSCVSKPSTEHASRTTGQPLGWAKQQVWGHCWNKCLSDKQPPEQTSCHSPTCFPGHGKWRGSASSVCWDTCWKRSLPGAAQTHWVRKDLTSHLVPA